MKIFFLFLFLLIINCAVDPELRGEIEWKDVLETSWVYTEYGTQQNIKMVFHFHTDTLFLTKTYINSKTGMVTWIRYIRAPVFNKHYEIPPGPPPDDINLVFTWIRKEYADPEFKTPIMDNSPLIEWFLWKIDGNGNLLMGEVDTQRQCWYWVFTREQSQ